MDKMDRRFFAKLTAVGAVAGLSLPAAASDVSDTYEITTNSNLVTVGNSLIDQSVDMLHDFMKRYRRGRGTLSHQTIPGASMNWNWLHAENAFTNARATLAQGRQNVFMGVESVPFRHVQGAGEICDIDAWRQWYDLATANGVTRVFLFEAWHDRMSGTPGYQPEDRADPDTGIPWRKRIDFARRHWEGIVDYVNSRREPQQPEMNMLPGGTMLGAIHDDIARGTAPSSLRSIDDLFLDTIHPNIKGRYAMACMMFAGIFRVSPVGFSGETSDIWGRPFETVPRDEARYFQELAWQIASADPITGIA